jgi:broad specificity phosphatase PhoE
LTSPVYLVRHVEVALVDGVPADEWLPTEAGLEAARRLATDPVWQDVDLVATSTEPKARATAEPIAAAAGVPLRAEPDLREVAREPAPVIEAAEHADRVRRYLEGEPIDGWEPHERARGRFERCLDRLVAETRGPLAVVSHATVLALYLGLTHDEWAAIPLPAVAVADPLNRRLLRPFRSVDEFLRVPAVRPEGRG